MRRQSDEFADKVASELKPLWEVVVKLPIAGASDPHPPHSDLGRDPYRGVVIVLLAAAIVGGWAALVGGTRFGNPVLVDTAITLGLSASILIGVAMAQKARLRSAKGVEKQVIPAEEAEMPARLEVSPEAGASTRRSRWTHFRVRLGSFFRDKGGVDRVRIGTAAAGAFAILLAANLNLARPNPSGLTVAIVATLCLIATGLAAISARYFSGVDPARLPEGLWLCKGARVVAWIFALAALSMGLMWTQQRIAIRILHFAILLINVAVCYGLASTRPSDNPAETFPLDLGVLSLLGSRPNILASVLDGSERQLGIDLRSTWALTVVRRMLEPLVIGLCLLGWLSTSLTVVDVHEQGLVERLGVPLKGQPILPGLHLHWPWPVDRVFRIPVQRVQAISVGHEGQEEPGPENVLWAREHAANEYTLLLGNGRDLITVDATVQFRITDARAWRYHCQNPADALRAIAYRAVMRSTVNRTLSEALSENVVALTGRMRAMVQQDADALGLGVDVITFTVGGMHPPVSVASDYEDVVSAEISKVTAVVNAQVFRNQNVPMAEASVLTRENTARAEGAGALARAAGESWSFRALQSEYGAAPQEYFFRRRLETLEKGLAGHPFTVVDFRFQRDGGELWLNR